MGRISRRALLAALAAMLACAALIVTPAPAWACSCAPVTTKQANENADAVFTGVVRSRVQVTRDDREVVELRFDVSTVFKGRVYAEQVVQTAIDSAGCGIEAQPGSTWIIFATESSAGTGDHQITRLTTTSCSGNLPGAVSPLELGRGQPPQPGASDTEEKTIRTDVRVDRVLTVVGLGALGVLAIGGVTLGLLWRRRPT